MWACARVHFGSQSPVIERGKGRGGEERDGVGCEERVEGDQRERHRHLFEGAQGGRIHVSFLYFLLFFRNFVSFYRQCSLFTLKDLGFLVASCVWMLLEYSMRVFNLFIY